MHAVRRGDVAKLRVLFERYHRPLFEFLARMTGNPAAAEDLVQDVFVRVLKYRATWRDEGRFETWLFRIARNARADYFRARSSDAPIDEAADHPSRAPLVIDTLARDREVARLQRALMLLREDKRELIVLARYRGMTLETIGHARRTARSTLARRNRHRLRAQSEYRGEASTRRARRRCPRAAIYRDAAAAWVPVDRRRAPASRR